ncbi:MAG: hypothetical protein RL538_377 [Candidatus Parcubacteria bacterium]
MGVVIAIILAFVGYSQYYVVRAPSDLEMLSKETVVSEEFGISFAYPTGEEGFTLVEPPAGDDKVKKSYLLFTTPGYRDFSNSTEPREAPAGISVLVYMLDEADAQATGTSTERESRIARLQNWAMDNDTLTSFSFAKATPDIIELDGVKALHYKADGLYQQDIYLASYKGRVYMLTGSYNEESDLTYRAFQDLIMTVAFD